MSALVPALAGVACVACAFLAFAFMAWGQSARTWGERCGSALGALAFSAATGALLPFILPYIGA